MNKVTIEEKICIVTTDLMQKLFERGGSDTVALYMFFYMTVKRQETNQIRATDKYCMNGLKWGKERVIKAKKILIDNGLIEQIVRKDKQGKITGWYLKINYIWSSDKTKQIQKTQNQTVASPDGGFQDTNALSNTKINALSNLNKVAQAPPDAFVFSKYLTEMDENKDRAIQFLAYFFRLRRLHFDSITEVRAAISRHIKGARKVIAFPEEKVTAAVDKCMKKYKDVDWTTETILKVLTN